jgi:hypothetical protein
VAGGWWERIVAFPSQDGVLASSPEWSSADAYVTEAFAWADLDRRDEEAGGASGDRLVEIPRGARVKSVTGGVVGDGYATGPGEVSVAWVRSRELDLVVTDWDPDVGSYVFARP